MWERHPRTPGVELLFFSVCSTLGSSVRYSAPEKCVFFLPVLYLHKGSSNTLLLPFKVPVHNPVISTRGRRSRLEHTRLVLIAITAGTHNPPLHLSHLQPFIRSRRQQSIHLPLSFTHTHIHAPLGFLRASFSFRSLPLSLHLNPICLSSPVILPGRVSLFPYFLALLCVGI